MAAEVSMCLSKRLNTLEPTCFSFLVGVLFLFGVHLPLGISTKSRVASEWEDDSLSPKKD